MPRTKIVCTIGPASGSAGTVLAMIRSGMRVARLNFSHGSHRDHARLFRLVRAAARKASEPVAILCDLQGPKIRVGALPAEGIELRPGQTVEVPVTYASLYRDVKPGERILIDDGLIEVEYVRGRRGFATIRALGAGTVTSHKGMNFPDTVLRVPALTEKDKEDAAFAVRLGADWVALSFVTSAGDVRALRRVLEKAGSRGVGESGSDRRGPRTPPRVIVKIEKHEAIDRFAEILSEADAIMIARGDLAVETPAADVPVRQKEIIAACRAAGKPVVVATQMLDSMTRNPRPTRAEVSDVANAVCDRADAVMLSGETATGKYPRQAVATMAAVAGETEASRFDDPTPCEPSARLTTAALGEELRARVAAGEVDAVLGHVALVPGIDALSVARIEAPVFLAYSIEAEARQAAIRWGVRPFAMKPPSRPDRFAALAIARLRKARLLKRGSRVAVVTVAGTEIVIA